MLLRKADRADERIEASDARDYLFQFAKHYCKKEVNEMLIKGVSQYVGPDKLSLLNFIEPNFIKPNRESQYFYFYNPQIEMFARFKMKSSFHKTKRII